MRTAALSVLVSLPGAGSIDDANGPDSADVPRSAAADARRLGIARAVVA